MIEVKLTWKGEPAPFTQIAIFCKPTRVQAPSIATRTLVTTVKDGVATVSLAVAGQYLLNAVRMEPVEGPGSVVWKSHWASLTFDLRSP